MDEMEAQLGAPFVRIRRSTLLRVGAVEYCEPWGKGSYVFVLRDRTRLTSSRYFRARLAPLFGD
jgi:DNA-binding LytR/AlgR family response regulator